MPRPAALLLVLLAAAACRTQPFDFDGGLPPGSVEDLATTSGSRDLATVRTRDMRATPTSCCGADGNPGNELGVGKFCQASSDCANEPANLCATTFSPSFTFCTMPCMMGGGNAQCGSGAQCQCAGGGQCACVPGECLMPPPGC